MVRRSTQVKRDFYGRTARTPAINTNNNNVHASPEVRKMTARESLPLSTGGRVAPKAPATLDAAATCAMLARGPSTTPAARGPSIAELWESWS